MAKFKFTKGGEIKGHLEIAISDNEDEFEGEVAKWQEVLIHGDPEGLTSLANLLLHIAELDQDAIQDEYLPVGAKEHYHLRPDLETSKSSVQAIVGRLDAKGTGLFHSRYVAKERMVKLTGKHKAG